MPYFAIELNRTQTQLVYVEADRMEDAVEAAWELADPKDWVPEDADQDVQRLERRPTSPFWTGGENGHWENLGA